MKAITIVIKPLEAKLFQDIEATSKLESYCVAIVGDTKVKNSVTKSVGKYPIWEDAITIRPEKHETCLFEVRDQSLPQTDNLIGSTQIDLREVAEHVRETKWYDLGNNGQVIGQVLIEIAYSAGEYPPDDVLYSESLKLAHEDHQHHSHSKSSSRNKLEAEDPIPEEPNAEKEEK